MPSLLYCQVLNLAENGVLLFAKKMQKIYTRKDFRVVSSGKIYISYYNIPEALELSDDARG